jgi:hypothetical protein
MFPYLKFVIRIPRAAIQKLKRGIEAAIFCLLLRKELLNGHENLDLQFD